MGAVYERSAPFLRKGGESISHLVSSSPLTSSGTLERARDILSLRAAREGTTAANLIEHTHAHNSRSCSRALFPSERLSADSVPYQSEPVPRHRNRAETHQSPQQPQLWPKLLSVRRAFLHFVRRFMSL